MHVPVTAPLQQLEQLLTPPVPARGVEGMPSLADRAGVRSPLEMVHLARARLALSCDPGLAARPSTLQRLRAAMAAHVPAGARVLAQALGRARQGVTALRQQLQDTPARLTGSAIPDLLRHADVRQAALASLLMTGGLGLAALSERQGPDLLGSTADPLTVQARPGSAVTAQEEVVALLGHPARPTHGLLASGGSSGMAPGPDPATLDSLHRVHQAVRPVAAALLAYNGDTALVRRIAEAVVQEAAQAHLAPATVVGIIGVEDDVLNLHARSSVGARGLMQVMPFHAGKWGCGSSDLTHIRSNICHGLRIFRDRLHATRGDFDRALLAYNGCVRGTTTPDCARYPTKVRANIQAAQRAMRAEEARMASETSRTPFGAAGRLAWDGSGPPGLRSQ